jgi:hypothetical protein
MPERQRHMQNVSVRWALAVCEAIGAAAKAKNELGALCGSSRVRYTNMKRLAGHDSV